MCSMFFSCTFIRRVWAPQIEQVNLISVGPEGANKDNYNL